MFGLAQDQIDEFIGERKKEALEIDAENWPAILVFCAMDTQWRSGPKGHLYGFDYSALQIVMRMQRVKNKPDTFARVQRIEREAISQFNRKLST